MTDPEIAHTALNHELVAEPWTVLAQPQHDGQCEAEFITGPMAWTACRCEERQGRQ